MSDDRLDRLEARIVALETLVRRLVAASPLTPEESGEVPPPRPLARPARPPIRAALEQARRPPPLRPVPPPAPDRERLPSEQWIGQRGLLAVGVTALVLAAAYLLKLSFDRGWISPALRCVMGVLGGLAIAAWGARLHERFRVYGAALVGGGAAIVYLALWAAGNLYALVAPIPAIGALALLSLALAAVAIRLDQEALGVAAALGAFFAPVAIESGVRNADLLLVYLTALAAALGAVAAARRWRLAALAVGASCLGLGLSAADVASPVIALGFGALGGAAGLHLGLREKWWELRVIAFGCGWAIIYAAGAAPSGLLLAAALVLALPVWRHGLRAPRFVPAGAIPRLAAIEWPLAEVAYFFLTPVLLGGALTREAPAFFAAHPGLAALIIALPYLAAGYAAPRTAFAAVGAAALAVAAWTGLTPAPAALALICLGVLLALLDPALGRSDGRWYALALAGAAILRLTDAMALRPAGSGAFVDVWALALWGVTAGVAFLAMRKWPETGNRDGPGIGTALWILAGGLLLFGVSGELSRLAGQVVTAPESARLAGGLAISAWWLLFAGALVMLGFARSLAPVRQAGLAVAILAILKVIFADLAGLDALYRVASVLLLGCVSLGIAYLYHVRARAGRAGS